MRMDTNALASYLAGEILDHIKFTENSCAITETMPTMEARGNHRTPSDKGEHHGQVNPH